MLSVEAGQVPYNMMAAASSSSLPGMPGAGNCLTVEQLQLMSHLAQQQQQQQRPVYAPLDAVLGHSQLYAGYMQPAPTPLSANNATVKPQPLLRGSSWLTVTMTTVPVSPPFLRGR